MNLPRVYTCSPSWTPLPHPSPYHPSGPSQCTSPKHPVSCIKPGLMIPFIYDIIHVSMPFSQIIPPSPSPTESKRLSYTSVSLLLFCIQGYHLGYNPLLFYFFCYSNCSSFDIESSFSWLLFPFDINCHHSVCVCMRVCVLNTSLFYGIIRCPPGSLSIVIDSDLESANSFLI